MPKYYEDKEEDGRACSGVREDLRQCLLESPCVLQENKSPKQCLKEGHCRSLQVTFFACKRSMKLCVFIPLFTDIFSDLHYNQI
ncbi:Cytochrome c oxidase assembly factor 5 [Turdus rufiventris]|nr:Cytochrome c oxidase assembly factor 5 [Turdus rufiventris]